MVNMIKIGSEIFCLTVKEQKINLETKTQIQKKRIIHAQKSLWILQVYLLTTELMIQI
jgi:hypothetical protein